MSTCFVKLTCCREKRSKHVNTQDLVLGKIFPLDVDRMGRSVTLMRLSPAKNAYVSLPASRIRPLHCCQRDGRARGDISRQVLRDMCVRGHQRARAQHCTYMTAGSATALRALEVSARWQSFISCSRLCTRPSGTLSPTASPGSAATSAST